MASSTPAATVAVHGPLVRTDLAELTARWTRELERLDGPQVVWVDVAGLVADAVAVDALCRLALAVQRRGARACLRNASPELVELIALAGLSGILAL
jgi:ABC-type transporter Mla MlaB component